MLCEREIARKDHRRIEMALKLAHFPAVQELAGFEFDAQPSIDPKQIRDLAASRWIANGDNVLLLDHPSAIHTAHLTISLELQQTIGPYREGERAEQGEVTLDEAAMALNVSASTVRRLIEDGTLAAQQLCKGAPWVIRLSDLGHQGPGWWAQRATGAIFRADH